MSRILNLVVVVLTLTAVATAGEIGFVEDFSLAPDRTVPLKQLIPGTEDYYYYHCLHFQNTEQFQKVEEQLPAWVQRHGETQRVWEIRTRQALLTYEKNPRKSLDYLIIRMGLNLNHQKEVLGAEPNLPTALDQAIISREQFVNRANAVRVDNLDGFEDSALDWLATVALNPNQRRNLLSRLNRPDHAGLVKVIVDDLNHENSGGFGSLVVHNHLLLAQLEELLKLMPALINQQKFVQLYLIRLQPGADEDWRHDTKLLEKYLDRLWAFAQRLAPVHNSLRAHALYHRLMLDRQRGDLSRERFLTYLQLPRPVGYAAKAFLESDSIKRFPCDLNSNYGGATLLTPIGNDEPLVRSYLAHFLVDAANTKEFDPYINDLYLRYLFAEVKIVNGLGEPETWASQLPPALFQQLKERVDIDFAFTNRITFGADEAVKLDLHVKNAQTLIVKVFEINTKNFYREQLREVDTDINLDGLVANEELSFNYAEPALRRVTRKFEFPKLNRPGVYVIDFIGNGRSSRVLVRKGRLRHVVRTGAAGQVFTVMDDQNKKINDATIWLAGHEYTAGKDGSIIVPFSNSPGRQPIVLSGGPTGSLSSLDYFNHEPENYSLVAGIYVDRESLLTRKKAQVVIRPGVFLNGTPVSISLLEEVKFTVTSTDLDGIATSQETPNFKLFEDRETVHEIQVPQRTAAISFTLTAKVKKLSAGGTKVDLSSSESFTLNNIERTERIEDLHLLRVPAGYAIELLGKTGEPKVSRPVILSIKHRDFRQPVNVALKTDPRGRINLGSLTDIASFTATGPENTAHTWSLRGDAHTYSQMLHGLVGQALTLPYLPRDSASGGREPAGNVPPGANQPANAGRSPGLSRSELSLLELRGNNFVADRFAHIKLKDGLLVLENLPAGDYDLLVKSSGSRLRVRITEGSALNNYLLGKVRTLETKPLAPLQIASIETAANTITVRLSNASKFARVHVFATRFVPEYSAFAHVSRVRDSEPYLFVPGTAETVYLTGRNIGDEYRYIIDRKLSKKYPGNTLDRPSLLLNPWAVRSTETGEQAAAGGDEFKRAGAPAPSAAARPESAPSDPAQQVAGNFANLDFLADGSAVLLNLIPENGVITIKREALGTHQHIHVVAVDPLNTTYRSVTLPEAKSLFVDLRLANALDAKSHFTQQKQVTVVPPQQPFVLSDITTSKFEAYDSLARVYALYATLSHDPKLVEFSFLLNWPKLKPEEQRAMYSKYTSHELSFFLARKDPEFFRTVIKPYLANKKDKTFLDRWLLEDDLRPYLLPWNHAQLNVVERTLLARRINGERPATARHVSDLYNLLPPNIDGYIRLFDTAVKGSALDTSDALGLVRMIENTVVVESFAIDSPVAAGEARPAPGGGGMGFGGGRAGGMGGGMKAPLSMGRASGKQQAESRKLSEKMDEAKKEMKAKDGLSRRRDLSLADADRAGEDKAAAGVALFGDLAERQLGVRALYRKLDKTMEWAENNYHHLTIDQQNADLVTVNAFWRDFAAHDPAEKFVSRNLAEASRNFPEMLLALAVLDLPFESPKHDNKFDGVKMTLTPGGPVIVYHEEIKPAKPNDGPAKILVSQNYFRHGDRHSQENGEQVDKYVTEEFVIHTVYGCQVVVTNPTSARQKLSVLLQVPRGAIPVLNSQPTKTLYLNLEPYHTQTIDYHFYFPAAGQFPHFPVHVAKNDDLIAFATPVTLNVVDKATKIDTQSWDYISQNGTSDDVLAFLTKNNVHGVNLERIAWRMRDAKFFEAAIKLLALRHVYQHTLWSYSMFHGVVPAAREFLQHADQIVNESGGGRLTSPLLTIDPVARRTFEHLEYKPLVNARAHALGKRRQIVNDRFNQQYHRFLRELQYQRTLGDDDLLTVTYDLLLQDRIEDALATFGRVNPDKLATRLQYDYFAAYLDFFTDDHAKARAIATKYAEHPVDRWKNAFVAIITQLDEAEGKNAKVADADDRGQQQTQLAATEPNFDFQVEAKQITLNHQNLDQVRVNYYLMDVELLFSRNPFVQQFSGQFSAIRPNSTAVVALNPVGGAGTTKIPLPAALLNKNVLVEITGGAQTKSQAYYSHSLTVQVIENYGQIRVTHATTTKPVTKAYVKVYAQTAGGQVKFYKDGYTDLRGRFDYASLNTNDLDVATKFSILILSDDAGAVVREATPPKQ
ncbi:MAG: hypothetical protein HZA46_11395 [Planctomycetales bacterium]|nr:hypothetical protein [Planctomycetales bacterium]